MAVIYGVCGVKVCGTTLLMSPRGPIRCVVVIMIERGVRCLEVGGIVHVKADYQKGIWRILIDTVTK